MQSSSLFFYPVLKKTFRVYTECMCFNAVMVTSIEEAERIYYAKLMGQFETPVYYSQAFAHPLWPVLEKRGDTRSLSLKNWGLIPHWYRQEDPREIQKYTLNARIETLTEKPSFRDAFKQSRCCVLMNGYYEWQHRGKEKIPYYITSHDGKPFPVAGLCSVWRDTRTFTIVTTAARGIMKEIHNTKERMPFILSRDECELWMDNSLEGREVRERVFPLYKEFTAIQRAPGDSW